MNEHQRKVMEFHKAFGITTKSRPSFPPKKDQELRKNLILEEAAEFVKASDSKDIVGIADALADLLYVVYGAAVTYGLDMEPVFEEVHRSNMSKAWKSIDDVADIVGSDHDLRENADGTFVVRRRSDGKVIKAPTYSPADLKKVIKALGDGKRQDHA